MPNIQFRNIRNPSPMVFNFAKAVARATVKPSDSPELPAIGLRMKDVVARSNHIAEYRKVCGFSDSLYMPITYPHMHAFPLHMQLMLDSRFPFPAMGLVHVKNNITQYRPIGVREQMDVEASLGNLVRVDKGYEFSVLTQISTAGELVWESESINFFRWGKSIGKKSPRTKLVAEKDTIEWQVPGNIGRRYGAVSGDRNPIHLFAVTAKLFGFKRQIAHGMWSKARCLAALEANFPKQPFSVDVQFKLPLFTPGTVKFAQHQTDQGIDFKLLAKDGIKPHLTGHIRQLAQ